MDWLGVRLKKTAVGLLAAATLASVGAVTTVGTALAATQTMVATGNVNLRSGPGTSYTIIAVVPLGATVTATGVTSGSWVQVTYGSKTGYVSGSYVKAAGATPTATATTSAPATSSAPATTGTATTTGSVNVRSGPGTSYTIVAVASPGTVVNTTGVTSGSWTQVVWNGTARWISTSYLKAGGSAGTTTPSTPSTPTTPAVVGQVRTTTNVNMRTAGNSSATIAGQLPANTVVDVTGQTTSTYTQILYGGKLLWIYSAYTTPVTASPLVTTTTASAKVQKIIDYAKSKLGMAYVWGGAGPNSFDCSGLTMAAYATVGISLPHHAADQATMGTPVTRANLQPGDLIFWYSPVGHVSIYIGNGQMIHARGTAYGVVQQTVDSYIAAGGSYTSARRFIS